MFADLITGKLDFEEKSLVEFAENDLKDLLDDTDYYVVSRHVLNKNQLFINFIVC